MGGNNLTVTNPLWDKTFLQILVNVKRRFQDIPWAIFAGTACYIYRSGRTPTDLDIIIRDDDLARAEGILGLKGKEIENDFEYVTKIGSENAEFVCKLYIKNKGSLSHYDFDSLMIERIRYKDFLGESIPVLSVEDVIVLKSLLQRDRTVGKFDLEDVAAVWHKNKIDTRYLLLRANICNGADRVKDALSRIGIFTER